STAHPEDIPRILVQVNDKIAHETGYFLLFLFGVHALQMARSEFVRRHVNALSYGYCAFMGVITEIAQIYVPGRSCDIRDWVADIAGAAIGFFFFRFLLLLSRFRPKPA